MLADGKEARQNKSILEFQRVIIINLRKRFVAFKQLSHMRAHLWCRDWELPNNLFWIRQGGWGLRIWSRAKQGYINLIHSEAQAP